MEKYKCERCGACCKFMLLELKDEVTEDYKRWFKYHLDFVPDLFYQATTKKVFEFVKLEGRNFLRINLPCDYLQENGKCVLLSKGGIIKFSMKKQKFYKEPRPQMCKDFHCEDPRYSHIKHLLEK